VRRRGDDIHLLGPRDRQVGVGPINLEFFGGTTRNTRESSLPKAAKKLHLKYYGTTGLLNFISKKRWEFHGIRSTKKLKNGNMYFQKILKTGLINFSAIQLQTPTAHRYPAGTGKLQKENVTALQM